MTIGEMIDKFRVWGFRGVKNYAIGRLTNRRHARRLARLAEESRDIKPVRGITVIADVTSQAALSKTMRDFILSLREISVPVQVYDTSGKCAIPLADAEGVVTPAADFVLRKYDHIVMMYRSPLDERLVPDIQCARIAFHESNFGIESTAPYLEASGDAIIAMSDFNYLYYQKVFANQPVFKIRYPLRFVKREVTPRDELRGKYGIEAEDFVVFFNFDFGSYYRKNPVAAIQAFSKAFADIPHTKLVFKTKNAKVYPKRAAELERASEKAGITGKFIHISDYLPRADIDGLTNACDVYLSLHRSEGFGLGMAEAMSCGKPVVATDWSANTEFCRADNSWPVPCSMTPILPHEYMVTMVEWANPDVEAAAKALCEIRANPQAAQERALEGRRFIEEYYSLDHFKCDVEAFLSGKAINPQGRDR